MTDIVEIKGPMKFNAAVFSPEQVDNDMTTEKWKYIAIKLWSLLDDIDTASDMLKPERNPFYEFAMSKVEQRFRYLASDGYKLFPLRRREDDRSAQNET